MPVDTFTRDEFEKALSFFPLGFKCTGASTGQLEYRAPVATRLTCSKCGTKFYPQPGYETAKCPKCGKIDKIPAGMLVPGEVFVYIYSSISPQTMRARNTGQDSIRFVLETGNRRVLGKLGHYTTRVPGWEERVRDKCRELWGLALRLPRCKRGHLAKLTKCKSGQNKGRIFAKCWKCDEWLGWMDGYERSYHVSQ